MQICRKFSILMKGTVIFFWHGLLFWTGLTGFTGFFLGLEIHAYPKLTQEDWGVLLNWGLVNFF